MLELKNRRAIHHLIGHRFLIGRHAAHDVEFFRMARVFHHDVEKETVELGFRQRISSLLLNRVLGRQYKERRVELVVFTTGRNAFFLHRFEQRGLRFRRCAVDLVREQKVREHGTFLELETATMGLWIFLQQLGASDVRGHQVGRELDALET